MKNSQSLVEFPLEHEKIETELHNNYYYNIFYEYFIIGVLQNQYGFSVDNINVKYKCLLNDTFTYMKKSLYDFYKEQIYYSMEKRDLLYDHRYYLQDTLILFTDNEKFILFNLMDRRFLSFLNIKNYIDPFIYEDILKHPNKIINKRYLKNHIFVDVNKNILKVHQFLQLEFRYNSCFDIIYDDIINNLSVQDEITKLMERSYKNTINFVNYSKYLNSDDYYLYDLYIGNLIKSKEDNERFRLFSDMKTLIIKNLNKISLIKNYVDNVCIDCMLDGYIVNRFNRNHLLKHIYELDYTRESMAQLIYKIKYLYPTLLNENLPRNRKATVSYIINVLDNGQYVFNIWSISPHILAENILYSLFKDNPDDIFKYNIIK